MSEPFYLPPGPTFEPGDIFADVPFPSLKHPLEFFRASPNPKNKGGATIFSAAEGHTPQPGDTARGAFTRRHVILLSWECELDAVLRDEETFKIDANRRYWLAAPLKSVDELGADMKTRTAEGRQPNKFLLPPDGPNSKSPFGATAYFADLRQITPITVPYFRDAKKIGSLSLNAIRSMQAHLGLFFSGLVVFVQPIQCPECHAEIDPTHFLADSSDDQDVD
jgi:hypothetical protein